MFPNKNDSSFYILQHNKKFLVKTKISYQFIIIGWRLTCYQSSLN